MLKQTEPKEVVVGDYHFYIRPFPAFKSANLTGELASVLAPLLGALMPLVGKLDGNNAEGNNGGLMDIDVSDAASAIMNCPEISGDKVELLLKKLLLGGHIGVEIPNEDGEVEAERLTEETANEIFCGDVQDMFILCFHVIRLNFNGFFKKLAGLSGKVKPAEAKTPRKIM